MTDISDSPKGKDYIDLLRAAVTVITWCSLSVTSVYLSWRTGHSGHLSNTFVNYCIAAAAFMTSAIAVLSLSNLAYHQWAKASARMPLIIVVCGNFLVPFASIALVLMMLYALLVPAINALEVATRSAA